MDRVKAKNGEIKITHYKGMVCTMDMHPDEHWKLYEAIYVANIELKRLDGMAEFLGNPDKRVKELCDFTSNLIQELDSI